MFSSTIQFPKRQDYTALKVAAVVNGVTVGELIDRMVDDELLQFTKQEAKRALPKNTKRERLLAAW